MKKCLCLLLLPTLFFASCKQSGKEQTSPTSQEEVIDKVEEERFNAFYSAYESTISRSGTIRITTLTENYSSSGVKTSDSTDVKTASFDAERKESLTGEGLFMKVEPKGSGYASAFSFGGQLVNAVWVDEHTAQDAYVKGSFTAQPLISPIVRAMGTAFFPEVHTYRDFLDFRLIYPLLAEDVGLLTMSFGKQGDGLQYFAHAHLDGGSRTDTVDLDFKISFNADGIVSYQTYEEQTYRDNLGRKTMTTTMEFLPLDEELLHSVSLADLSVSNHQSEQVEVWYRGCRLATGNFEYGSFINKHSVLALLPYELGDETVYLDEALTKPFEPFTFDSRSPRVFYVGGSVGAEETTILTCEHTCLQSEDPNTQKAIQRQFGPYGAYRNMPLLPKKAEAESIEINVSENQLAFFNGERIAESGSYNLIPSQVNALAKYVFQ